MQLKTETERDTFIEEQGDRFRNRKQMERKMRLIQSRQEIDRERDTERFIDRQRRSGEDTQMAIWLGKDTGMQRGVPR